MEPLYYTGPSVTEMFLDTLHVRFRVARYILILFFACKFTPLFVSFPKHPSLYNMFLRKINGQIQQGATGFNTEIKKFKNLLMKALKFCFPCVKYADNLLA